MPVLQGNCNLRKPGSVSLPFLFFVGFFFFGLEILTQQENVGCSGEVQRL